MRVFAWSKRCHRELWKMSNKKWDMQSVTVRSVEEWWYKTVRKYCLYENRLSQRVKTRDWNVMLIETQCWLRHNVDFAFSSCEIGSKLLLQGVQFQSRSYPKQPPASSKHIYLQQLFCLLYIDDPLPFTMFTAEKVNQSIPLLSQVASSLLSNSDHHWISRSTTQF